MTHTVNTLAKAMLGIGAVRHGSVLVGTAKRPKLPNGLAAVNMKRMSHVWIGQPRTERR